MTCWRFSKHLRSSKCNFFALWSIWQKTNIAHLPEKNIPRVNCGGGAGSIMLSVTLGLLLASLTNALLTRTVTFDGWLALGRVTVVARFFRCFNNMLYIQFGIFIYFYNQTLINTFPELCLRLLLINSFIFMLLFV